MSPRKAAKIADAPAKPSAEVKSEPVPAAKAEARPARPSRAKAKKVEAVEPIEVAPETVPEPAPEPVKPKGRKPKAAPKEIPAPEAAPVPPPPAPVPAPAFDGHLGTVLAAIRDGKAVELIFLDPEANPPRTFEPRQLIYDVFTQAWYLWGWDRRYNAERHHRVDALAEANLVDGPGRAAQGPFAEGTPANQIGGWRGGEPIPVKVQLQKQWVFAVRQAPAPFPDFKMEEGEDGRATVTFFATDLRAIARWVMQFGDGITVLEPQRLVDRVRQVAQAWGAKVAPPAAAAPTPKPEPVREEPRHRSRPEPAHRPKEREREREHHREAEAPAKQPRIEIRLDRL